MKREQDDRPLTWEDRLRNADKLLGGKALADLAVDGEVDMRTIVEYEETMETDKASRWTVCAVGEALDFGDVDDEDDLGIAISKKAPDLFDLGACFGVASEDGNLPRAKHWYDEIHRVIKRDGKDVIRKAIMAEYERAHADYCKTLRQ